MIFSLEVVKAQNFLFYVLLLDLNCSKTTNRQSNYFQHLRQSDLKPKNPDIPTIGQTDRQTSGKLSGSAPLKLGRYLGEGGKLQNVNIVKQFTDIL